MLEFKYIVDGVSKLTMRVPIQFSEEEIERRKAMAIETWDLYGGEFVATVKKGKR